MAFYDTAEIEISDWLDARPEIRRSSELGHGWVPELLTSRIANRSQRGLNLSIPSAQQINFETASHNLALPDLVITAAVIIFINRRMRGFYP